ncbi:MAG TPA: PAS domain S-box protein [Actinomycetota bacterium]|nr:PAS domain S-box protein [Actinomycetota bacterium]
MKQDNRLVWPSQALLAAIVESTGDGVLVVTLDGLISAANPAAAEMFGYSRDELLTLTLDDVTVPERKQTIAGIMARLRRGDQVPRYRTVLVRNGGVRFPVSLTVSLVRGDNGLPPMVSAIIQDLTSERASYDSRALLAAIVQSSEDAIYSRTPDGVITTWNESAQRLFGYSSDEILGQSIHVLVPQDVAQELDDMAARMRAGEAITDWKTIRLRRDGARIPVAITAFPVVVDGTVAAYAMIARDMLRDADAQRAFRNLERLTARERDVLGLVSDGLGNAEISQRLGLSPQTVKNYVSRILMKLNVGSRTQAAASFLSLRSFLGPPPRQE